MRSRLHHLTILALSTLLTALAWAGPPNPTVTLSISPTTGVSPLNVTLTWNSTGAANCTGTGAWSGAKTTSGTQTITGVTATSTYTLSCSAASGWADLSWLAPTQNVDGSPLTNLAGFKVYQALTAAGTLTATPIVISSPTAVTYGITGLSPATYFWAMTAFNASGVESVQTAAVSKAVTLPTATASATVTVTTKPNPPTLVTVSTFAYEFKNSTVTRMVGTVPLNTACGKFASSKWGSTFYEVPLESVALSKPVADGTVIVAECATTALNAS